ncbi:tyrosine-type recombinase/integrase [Nocardioides bruguierae]|uniref:tyrosine-type recombinase/integrase n=1 Tax=Nocardioides bruguierae TaxID=2945102 RepID=UPI0020212C1C|nr:tyrosine-type recombinase/integrase [Nocardioides bruguierae]MCL8027676.1 tyrosine-type recombinase/integrase [Nocardioides bruguierae]
MVSELATNLDGSKAASTTSARRRAVLHGCLQAAVHEGLLPENPLVRVPRTRKTRHAAVDRRVVINPDQARAILDAVRRVSPELESYFACLYYAGLRPAEARNLRLVNCHLPSAGWGRLTLTGSYQSVGGAFTDGGVSGEERELKHRDPAESREVPAHPQLVQALRRHVQEFTRSSDGRLFVNRTGTSGVPLPPPHESPVSMSTVYRAWHRARAEALGTSDSFLARRPYDLRHAAVSTWLNAGVPAAQVADWAGHTVAVLLTVYAKCIDGEQDAALKRIEQATAR